MLPNFVFYKCYFLINCIFFALILDLYWASLKLQNGNAVSSVKINRFYDKNTHIKIVIPEFCTYKIDGWSSKVVFRVLCVTLGSLLFQSISVFFFSLVSLALYLSLFRDLFSHSKWCLKTKTVWIQREQTRFSRNLK